MRTSILPALLFVLGFAACTESQQVTESSGQVPDSPKFAKAATVSPVSLIVTI